MDHHHHNHMAMTTVKPKEKKAQENSGDMNHMMMMTVFNLMKTLFLTLKKIPKNNVYIQNKKKMYFHGFQENEKILFKSWEITSVAGRKN